MSIETVKRHVLCSCFQRNIINFLMILVARPVLANIGHGWFVLLSPQANHSLERRSVSKSLIVFTDKIQSLYSFFTVL